MNNANSGLYQREMDVTLKVEKTGSLDRELVCKESTITNNIM